MVALFSQDDGKPVNKWYPAYAPLYLKRKEFGTHENLFTHATQIYAET